MHGNYKPRIDGDHKWLTFGHKESVTIAGQLDVVIGAKLSLKHSTDMTIGVANTINLTQGVKIELAQAQVLKQLSTEMSSATTKLITSAITIIG